MTTEADMLRRYVCDWYGWRALEFVILKARVGPRRYSIRLALPSGGTVRVSGKSNDFMAWLALPEAERPYPGWRKERAG